MKDTHNEIQALFEKMILEKSVEERVLLGLSMFQTSKLLVLSRLKREKPSLTEKQLMKLLIKEFYPY